MTTPTINPPTQTQKRRHLTFFSIFIFVSIGLAYLLYWIFWGRFYESTDDAYVNGNMVVLTPQIDGIVTSIWADNADMVKEGQLLVEIDPHDYEIAFEKAKAELALTVRHVVQLFTKVTELEAVLESKKGDLARATLDFEHRKALVESLSVSKEDFEHSETNLYSAYANFKATEEMLKSAYAEVEGTDIYTHPLVTLAGDIVRKAFLALHRCKVLSPTTGIVTQRKAQVGMQILATSPLLAVVPLDQIWVDANFREVQLKEFRIGQPVHLHSDMYGRGVVFHGKIVGMNPGTGSVFSILPPQNATGNWIKIIQRIPVKISIDKDECALHPLLLGLSMYAKVDLHDISGEQIPPLTEEIPVYNTNIYADELANVETIIQEIIETNAHP